MRPGIASVMLGTGKAARCQAFVFNFARIWDQFYLNLD
jgi:hypothetical protein